MELGETVVTPPDPEKPASTPMTLDEVVAWAPGVPDALPADMPRVLTCLAR